MKKLVTAFAQANNLGSILSARQEKKTLKQNRRNNHQLHVTLNVDHFEAMVEKNYYKNETNRKVAVISAFFETPSLHFLLLIFSLFFVCY